MKYLVYDMDARWQIDVCFFDEKDSSWGFDMVSDLRSTQPQSHEQWSGPYEKYLVCADYDGINNVVKHRSAQEIYKQADDLGLTREDLRTIAHCYKQYYGMPMPDRPAPPAPAMSARVERAQKAVSPWLRESARRAFENAALDGGRPRNIIQHYPCRGPSYDYWGNRIK